MIRRDNERAIKKERNNNGNHLNQARWPINFPNLFVKQVLCAVAYTHLNNGYES